MPSSSHLRKGDSDSTIDDHRCSPYRRQRRGLSRPMPNSPLHAPATRQLRLCQRALQEKRRWACTEPAPEPTTRLVSSSPQGASSAAPTSEDKRGPATPRSHRMRPTTKTQQQTRLRSKPPSLPHKKPRKASTSPDRHLPTAMSRASSP